MTRETLEQRVDYVISLGDDPESAHSAEDYLHLQVIREFCPDWVVAEIERLNDADFARWCA